MKPHPCPPDRETGGGTREKNGGASSAFSLSLREAAIQPRLGGRFVLGEAYGVRLMAYGLHALCPTPYASPQSNFPRYALRLSSCQMVLVLTSASSVKFSGSVTASAMLADLALALSA